MTTERRQDGRQGRRIPRPSARLRPWAEAMEERRLMAAGVTSYPVPTPAASPNAIAVDANGNAWFTERDADKNARNDTNRELTEFNVPKPDAQPNGIAAGGYYGVIVFTEANAHQIGQIDAQGRITEFSLPDRSARPGAAVAGPEGSVWFSESFPSGASGAIGEFQPGGAILEFPLPPSAGAAALTLGPDGNVWFVDAPRNAVGRITPAGSVTEFPIPTAASGLSGITAGADGNLWFTETAAHQIGKVTPAGVVTEYPLNTPDASPVGIAAGPDGELWFTETNAPGPSIGRINPGTAVVTDFPLPAGFVAPTAIASSPGFQFPHSGASPPPPGLVGNPPLPPIPDSLVFTDPAGNRVGRIVTDPGSGFETFATEPQTLAEFQGREFPGDLVATFQTSLPHIGAGDFTVTIDWGDGSPTTAGTVSPDYLDAEPSPDTSYAFVVRGTHTYARAGTFPIQVTIHDTFGDSTTVTSQAVVSNLPFAVTPSVNDFASTQPEYPLGEVYLATPTSDTFPVNAVTVDWGDGTTSPGRLDPIADYEASPAHPPAYGIVGNHVYDRDGTYTVSFVVTDQQGRSVTTTTTIRAVVDTHAPLVFGVYDDAVARSPRTGVQVADFNDYSRPGAIPGDYTATVDWGDGTSSAGTVAPYQYSGGELVPGRFSVSADHTYAHAGRFTKTVTVSRTDGSGAGSTKGGTTVMEPSQFTGYASGFPAFESPPFENPNTGRAFTPWLVTLSTPDTTATPGNYAALIDWGDGTPLTPGVVTSAPPTGLPAPPLVTLFQINGGHTYTQAGTYMARVTVTQSDGKTSQFVTDFTVTDPLSNPPPPPPPLPPVIITLPIEFGFGPSGTPAVSTTTPPTPTPTPAPPLPAVVPLLPTTRPAPPFINVRDLEYLIRLGSTPVGHGRHHRTPHHHPTGPAGRWAARTTFAIRHAHRGRHF